MARIEPVVILAVRTLYLAVAARRVRADQLVLNAKTLQGAFKERRLILFGRRKAVCKLKAVACPDTLNRNTAPLKPRHGTLGKVRR